MTPAPPTFELAAFIEARLSEWERDALAATPGPWIVPDNSNGGVWVHQDGNDWDDVVSDTDGTPADAAHIARHDPARVLAQVAALRAVVAEFETFSKLADARSEATSLPEALTQRGIVVGMERTLRHVAAIWADDPAFDPAWSA